MRRARVVGTILTAGAVSSAVAQGPPAPAAAAIDANLALAYDELNRR